MAKSQYEVDLDLVPEGSAKSYKAGTITDQHDMRRVGKTQELRVGGWIDCILGFRNADELAAQLPPHISIGVYRDTYVYMGSDLLVRWFPYYI